MTENINDKYLADEIIEILESRIEVLAGNEEKSRNHYLDMIQTTRLPEGRDLLPLSEFSARAHVHNSKAAAIRWVLHDLKCRLGIEKLDLATHKQP